MKSILQYFKPVPTKEKKEDINILPTPHGPLSSKIPPGAIEAANERVSPKLQPAPTELTGGSNTIRGNYMKTSDAQRFAIVKRAAQFGTTAAIRHFASKYPKQFKSLKEPTVRRWKNMYKADRSHGDGDNDSQEEEESQELCLKKIGQPLKLGDELDKQVREYVRDL